MFTKIATAPEKRQIENLYEETPTQAEMDEDRKILEEGDVVSVLAAAGSGEMWWLLRLTSDLLIDRPGCKLQGQYMDYESEDDAGNRIFSGSDEINTTVKLSSVLKDEEGYPFIIVKEHYQETEDGLILNPEACHGLDELVVLNTEPINDSEEDGEEEPEEQCLPEKHPRRIASYGVDINYKFFSCPTHKCINKTPYTYSIAPLSRSWGTSRITSSYPSFEL